MDITSYTDIRCCEETRNINDLFARYKKERQMIIDWLLSDPNRLIDNIWKKTGILSVDDECQCGMGSKAQRSIFSCAQCRNLGRLINPREKSSDRSFLIKCGTLVGHKLIITEYPSERFYLEWDPHADDRAQIIFSNNTLLSQCGTPHISPVRRLAGDGYTINSLIAWLIERVMQEQKLPHYQSIYTSFICGKNGFTVSDSTTIMNLADIKLTTKIALNIFQQITIILRVLQQINFTHGYPSIQNLLIQNKPINYLYDGIHVFGSLTLMLRNFYGSSVEVNNVHLFTRNKKAEFVFDNNTFTPEIHSICPNDHDHTSCHNGMSYLVYRLPRNDKYLFAYMRHSGISLFPTSSDFYCFITAFMRNNEFYNLVKYDPKLHKIWMLLWLPEELPIIEERLKTWPEDAFVLQNLWLRCDIVEFVWKLLKIL